MQSHIEQHKSAIHIVVKLVIRDSLLFVKDREQLYERRFRSRLTSNNKSYLDITKQKAFINIVIEPSCKQKKLRTIHKNLMNNAIAYNCIPCFENNSKFYSEKSYIVFIICFNENYIED